MNGPRYRSTGEETTLDSIDSTAVSRSTPPRSASATPSQNPITCTTRARLIATFICSAWPFSPTRRTFGPIALNTGSARSNAACDPPAKIASSPASSVATLPETGASSISAPASATRSAIPALACGAIVLMSAQTAPGASPAITPSSPSAICIPASCQ